MNVFLSVCIPPIPTRCHAIPLAHSWNWPSCNKKHGRLKVWKNWWPKLFPEEIISTHMNIQSITSRVGHIYYALNSYLMRMTCTKQIILKQPRNCLFYLMSVGGSITARMSLVAVAASWNFNVSYDTMDIWAYIQLRKDLKISPLQFTAGAGVCGTLTPSSECNQRVCIFIQVIPYDCWKTHREDEVAECDFLRELE